MAIRASASDLVIKDCLDTPCVDSHAEWRRPPSCAALRRWAKQQVERPAVRASTGRAAVQFADRRRK